MTHRTVTKTPFLLGLGFLASILLVHAPEASAGKRSHKYKNQYQTSQHNHYASNFDRNRDGFLSVEERARQRFDTDRNGFLDRWERRRLRSYLRSDAYNRKLRRQRKAERKARRFMRRFDANYDGVLSRREVRRAGWARKFWFLDGNRSGAVDRYELVSHFGGYDRRVVFPQVGYVPQPRPRRVVTVDGTVHGTSWASSRY